MQIKNTHWLKTARLILKSFLMIYRHRRNAICLKRRRCWHFFRAPAMAIRPKGSTWCKILFVVLWKSTVMAWCCSQSSMQQKQNRSVKLLRASQRQLFNSTAIQSVGSNIQNLLICIILSSDVRHFINCRQFCTSAHWLQNTFIIAQRARNAGQIRFFHANCSLWFQHVVKSLEIGTFLNAF